MRHCSGSVCTWSSSVDIGAVLYVKHIYNIRVMTNVAAMSLIFLFSTIIIIWYNIISFNEKNTSSPIYARMNGGPAAAGGMPLNIKRPRSSPTLLLYTYSYSQWRRWFQWNYFIYVYESRSPVRLLTRFYI